jgi:hypothetical protein
VKTRDLAIVAAVVLIGGFAAADALRNRASDAPPRTAAATRTEEDRRVTTSGDEAREQFPPLTAPGSLVFADAGGVGCQLREVSVGTGIEFPLPRIFTECELIASPRGDGIAYQPAGVFADVPEATVFRFLDLNHARRDLGAATALFGLIAWSRDGQRAAWCDRVGSGFDYELGREAVRLDHCPQAYTPQGRTAHTDGRRILVGDRVVFTSRSHIDHFLWSADGSLVVLVEGNRLERWDDGRRTAAVNLPDTVRGFPILAPNDHFVAFTQPGLVVHVFDLERKRDWTVPGQAAAWSPNGEWLAAAEDEAITFYDVAGTAGKVRWTVAASAVAWH